MMNDALAIGFLVLAMIIVFPVFLIVGAIVVIHILEDYQTNKEYDHCIPKDGGKRGES